MKQAFYWLAIAALAVVLTGVGAFSGCLVGAGGRGILDRGPSNGWVIGLAIGGGVGFALALWLGARWRPRR